MAYTKIVELIETSIFTKQINRLLDEKTYAEFREYLIFNPLKGKLIKGGGGIRKIRWKTKNAGKSGGVRIIYFIKTEVKIYLLCAYSKDEAESLSKRQVNMLAKVVNDL